MDIRQIRERINLVIYDSKQRVIQVVNILGLLAAVLSIGTMFYYFGHKHTAAEERFLFSLIEISFAAFILRYFIRLVYDFSPKTFIKERWPEGILILLLLIDAASYNLTGRLVIQRLFNSSGLGGLSGLSNLILQFYILIIVILDLKQKTNFLPYFKLHPAAVFIYTFLIIIAFGTALLMMPEMSYAEDGMPLLDALFTSTSATCVTGLIVVDTGTYFTTKGHAVILMLMQLGGLNIISFGAFRSLFSRLGLGLKHHDVVEDFVFRDSVFGSKGLLARIIIGSLSIEIIGAGLILWLMSIKYPELGWGENAFFAVFHAVSAFNNAGFSTVTDGMFSEMHRYFFVLHLVVAALIMVGTLGFDTLFDLFDRQKLRERLKYPWKRPRIGTLLNLYTTALLVGTGTVLFFIFEWDRSMAGYTFVDSMVTSLFQTISLRTAGFNSVDFHHVAPPMLIVTILFMFVGGSSSSTAGGIKTSTFSILALSTYSTIRGKKRLEVFNRTIHRDIVSRAVAIFLFSLTGVVVGLFLLSITEKHILAMSDRSILDLLFEQVSAFSTVGLSMGITSMLSPMGKIILIVSMFIGRLGTLTIAFAFSRSIKSTNYKYPEERMLVG